MNFSIARFMQITTSTSYCYDTAIFSCVNEDRSYVTWELRNEEEGYFYARSVALFSPSSSITSQGLSNITLEITYRNSTFMATTLTITKTSFLLPVTVVCDRGTKEELEYNIIPGKLAVSIFSTVLQLFLCSV